MEAVPIRVGRTTLLVETSDVPVGDVVLPSADKYGTTETSSRLVDAYTQLKEFLADVSDDLGATMASKGGSGLSTLSVEFGLTFTGEANVWVMKAGGGASVRATLTWDLTQPAR